MNRLFWIAGIAILTGCVSDHQKSEPSARLSIEKSASIDAFAGTYQNLAFDHASRPQATLAEYVFGNLQSGISDVDAVTVRIDQNGDLIFSGSQGGQEKFSATYRKSGGYSLSRGVVRLVSSSTAASPDSGHAGTQSVESSVSLTVQGSLVYRTTREFRGMAYGLVPASTSRERVSVFERKQAVETVASRTQ